MGILSLDIYEPLGKLSFGAYVIHDCYFNLFSATNFGWLHFTPFLNIIFAGGIAVISFLTALGIYLFFEFPVARLFSRLLDGKKKPKAKKVERTSLITVAVAKGEDELIILKSGDDREATTSATKKTDAQESLPSLQKVDSAGAA